MKRLLLLAGPPEPRQAFHRLNGLLHGAGRRTAPPRVPSPLWSTSGTAARGGTSGSAGNGSGQRLNGDDWKKRKGERRVDLTRLLDRLPPQAIEAEMALLGSMILDWRTVGDVVQVLVDPDAFHKPEHQSIYGVLVELYDKHQSIDMVQLHAKLSDRGVLEQVGGLDYLIELGEAVPSASGAVRYAEIVRDKALLRKMIHTAGTILEDCHGCDEPVVELFDRIESTIFEIAEKRSADGTAALSALLQETFDKLEAQDGQVITGIETGFTDLDEMTNGLQPGELIIVAARPSMGKAQPLDAGVLTPRGWTPMGELEVGDEVASVDGRPSEVTGVYPQGERQVFRVLFADGRSAECCAEHLWRVSFRGWEAPRVLETRELMEMLKKQRYRNRLFVETFSGDFGDDGDLPLDPYALGCLIGDGCLRGSSVRFSNVDATVLANFEAAIGEGRKLVDAGGADWRVVQEGGARVAGVQGARLNPVKEALRDLGLWDRGAAGKFIPPRYLHASRDARTRLMAGLIDTDGWVESWGSLRFATASLRLARGVVELTRSLGGTASYTVKQTSYRYEGAKRAGLPAYVCNLQHPDAAAFATAPAKRERLADAEGVSRRARRRNLNIVSIEPTRVCETRCIAVSHPDHLYVTDGYTVTHNTAFALNVSEHIGAVSGRPVGVFSLEMSKQQLAQRLLCSRSQVDSHRLRRNMLSRDDFGKLSHAVGELSEAPIFIDDTAGLTLMGLRAKARRMKQRYGIEALMVDYLQLMSNPATKDGRQNEVSAISRGVKALARELECPIICLSQLNRAAEQREGHRPRMSDLRESGSIEQDADVIMMLHREDYYHRGDPEHVDNHEAEVIVTKQRNGPTGTVRLMFDGGTTRFKNLAHGGSPPAY